MKLNHTFKNYFIYVVALLHILLFTYAAVSKLIDFQNFHTQLGKSPLLNAFADYFAVIVPSIEIIISIILMIPKYRMAAISASCFLMFLFTVYIVMILNFTSFVPCSCGGVLEDLNWNEHLIFNIAFVILGLATLYLQSSFRHLIIISIIGGSIGIAFMYGLFLLSEDIIKTENPFIRRFPQGTAAKTAQIDLKNPSFYIAGTTSERIYLANPEAPLQVFEYDRNLKLVKQHTIHLQKEDYPFKALQTKVLFPYFFIYDKTVPIIYRGLVSDWKGNIINDKKYFFTKITFVDSTHLIIRTFKHNSYVNTLATVTNSDSLTITYRPAILQNQADGIFSTDGTMQYSKELKKMVYTYYYRNQYIITDNNLNAIKRGRTIDTTTVAKLKIVKNNKSGDTQLAAPPFMVNNLTTVTGNLLMVNSMLRGRYESVDVWKTATAVDVYDLTNQNYLLSFYVYNEQKYPMKDFSATKNELYIISGHFLIKYGFGEQITTKFHN